MARASVVMGFKRRRAVQLRQPRHVGVIVAAPAFFWRLIFVFARSKGRSGLLWGLLACFLPGITIIILLLVPPVSRDQRDGCYPPCSSTLKSSRMAVSS